MTNPTKTSEPQAQQVGMCEVCYQQFGPEDLEDGVTMSADCCGRIGLCTECRKHGNHDCDEETYR